MHSPGLSAVEQAVVDAVTETRESNARIAAALEDFSAYLKTQQGRSRSTSNAENHFHLGGITNAIAICGFGVCIIAFMLFAIWTMWQQADIKSQQEAWIQVWQQHVAEHKAKGE